MKIQVKVIPRAAKQKAEKLPDGSYKLWITAPPVDGKANRAAIEVLAKFFHRPKASISIIKGKTSSHKVIEVT
ncbi:DUF167 domain-containing protein [Fibrobacterota bacterium]